MKYTTKYLTYGLLIVIVIFGLGWFIQSQRTAKEALSVAPSDTDVPIPIPHLSSKRSAADGHFHADGSFHADSTTPSIENNTQSVSKNGLAPSHHSSRQKTANKSSLGWITWKFGHTGIRSMSPYYPDSTPLPMELRKAIGLLGSEQNARKSLQNVLLFDGKDIDDLLNSKHEDLGLNGVEIIGRRYGVPDPMSVLLDKKGNPLPPFTESEYEAEDLRRLVGDRDPEEAAQFLAQHGHYHPTLLSLLDDESAFDYLYAITLPIGNETDSDARMYAERLVSSDPDHLKARLYLGGYRPAFLCIGL